MTGRLEGKIAIVTGARMGIGEAIARRFAAEGATVVAADVESATDADWPAGVHQVVHDVSDPAGWTTLVADTTRDHGVPTILVNNAAILGSQAVEDVTLDEWNFVIGVNLTGPVMGMRSVIPGMRAAGGGAIVNMSSMNGIVATPGIAAYHATKGGVRLVTKSAAVTYAPDNIRVNSVHPGIISTPGVMRLPTDGTDAIIAATPLGRMGRPEEVAAMVLFLASDEASFVTGTEFLIDGGYMAQ